MTVNFYPVKLHLFAYKSSSRNLLLSHKNTSYLIVSFQINYMKANLLYGVSKNPVQSSVVLITSSHKTKKNSQNDIHIKGITA